MPLNVRKEKLTDLIEDAKELGFDKKLIKNFEHQLKEVVDEMEKIKERKKKFRELNGTGRKNK